MCSSISTKAPVCVCLWLLLAQSEILDPADTETIEALKKEFSTALGLLKIVQQLHKVLFPTRVGAGQVRVAAGNNISGQVKATPGNNICGQVRASAGNIISGQVRASAGNIISGQVRAGNIISEQAGLRKHVGNRWE
ncbi:unnamed protein product [Arabidopsis lyrata]|uniref:Uncharacterized protein n=1 Tax=Arabidopsis lyrata subsp. lyrata TaxID=81972 RepID=D7LI44_ARALL|nr:hypothetical protein ARALYDRAFT_903583 [Arabidopsis lyrata subsp. lyrata]CAH8265681.1 unnamed protein product [Arabidopsis lyrata]